MLARVGITSIIEKPLVGMTLQRLARAGRGRRCWYASVATAGAAAEIPTYHHPDMYRDDMIINLYAVHRQEMPNIMVTEKSELNRGQ